ncbi:MAG: hypothetical protein U0587_10165 [Candidatus Binatia bacterium]
MFFTSVLAPEHLGLLAALAAQTVLVSAVQSPTPRWTSVALSGVLMAVASVVRSASWVLFLAGVLRVPLLSRPGRRALFEVLLLVNGFWLTHAAYRQGMHTIYHITPEAQIDWTLLQGTNFDSRGAWNDADARTFMDRPTFEEARAFARAEAFRRMTSEPRRFAKLVIRKQVELWRDDGYGVYWSVDQFEVPSRTATVMAWKDSLSWLSRCYHLLVLVLGTAGCLLLMRTDIRRGLVLIVMLLLVGTWAHGVIEVQWRYHYVFEPALFVLAAMAAVALLPQRPLPN